MRQKFHPPKDQQKKNYPVTLIKFFGQQQKLYLKDTTDFINFIEKTKLPKEVIFVSMSERRDTDIFLKIPPDN